jgi:hypothetical protein
LIFSRIQNPSLTKFKKPLQWVLEIKTPWRAREQEGTMNPIISKCPVCAGELVVTRLHCPACETTIEGAFDPSVSGTRLQEAFSPEQLKPMLPFSRLSAEQLHFVLTFVRCEGRFTRMEEELGLSYPTLRNRLNDVIRTMGFEPSRDDPGRPEGARAEAQKSTGPAPVVPGPAERQQILDLLGRGEINIEDAKRRLRGEPPAEGEVRE